MAEAPIRIFLDRIIYTFSNLKDSVHSQHREALKNGKIDKKLFLESYPSPFSLPHIPSNSNHIVMHEDFLSYLWSMIYFIQFHVAANNDSRFYNKCSSELIIERIEVKNAFNLFFWSISLNKSHSLWDLKLPNPKSYDDFSDFEKKIIDSTNNVFPVLEKEADSFARRTIFDTNDSPNTKRTSSFAIISANISLLFLIKSPTSIITDRHPDIDSRIFDAFFDISIEDDSFIEYLVEAIANACIKFFSVHSIPFTIKPHYTDYKECLKELFEKFDELKSH